MRGIVDGRIGAGAESNYAEVALRALGLALDEARKIAHGPLHEAPVQSK
jgi:hypothetical protein